MEASALAVIYGFIRSYGEAQLGRVDRGMNYGNTHYIIHNMVLMIFTNRSAFYGFILEALVIRCGMWWCLCMGVRLCVILVHN